MLDKNVPRAFYEEIRSRGVACRMAARVSLDFLGRHQETLGDLENGALTRAAVHLGFSAILTRDKTYEDDARAELATTPNFNVVVILFNQSPPDTLPQRIADALDAHGLPIPGSDGQVTHWPPNGRSL